MGGLSHMIEDGCQQIWNKKKEMKRTMFQEGPRMSLRIEATQVGMHHTKTWTFLARELKVHSYELQMNQLIND